MTAHPLQGEAQDQVCVPRPARFGVITAEQIDFLADVLAGAIEQAVAK